MFAKVKYLIVIGLLFLIPACATGQATGSSAVDIDATVEARVASILTPTPQIVIQEVTSTPTPISPTVIPTAIPPTVIPTAIPPTVTPTPMPPTAIPPTVTPIPTTAAFPYVPIPSTATAVPITKGTATPEVYEEPVFEEPVNEEPVSQEPMGGAQEQTGTPTPIPTATPTATPIPDASNYVNVNITARTTDNGIHVYKDGLITNTHPTTPISVTLKEVVYDNNGLQITSNVFGESSCIFPNETNRFRRLVRSQFYINNEYVYPTLDEHEIRLETKWDDYCNNLYDNKFYHQIDESLLDKVDIKIIGDGSSVTRSFKVEVTNRSEREIVWFGEYLLKDAFGYIIKRKIVQIGKKVGHATYWISWLAPNAMENQGVDWNWSDSFKTGAFCCDWDNSNNGYVYLYYDLFGTQMTDLFIPNATLRTIGLYSRPASPITPTPTPTRIPQGTLSTPTPVTPPIPTPTPTPIPIDYGGGNINSGEIVESSIDYIGDVDEWEFTAYAPSKVTIAMNLINPNDSLNPYLELISPFGTIVASDDDGGGSKNASISEFEVTVSGKYIIRAQGSSLKTTGSYLILFNIN